jgi:hypothetical protein
MPPFVSEMSNVLTLKVADLAIGPGGSYVEKTVTIASITEEVVNDETGEKGWLARFIGARKGLKLNATNLNWGATNLGPHTDQWIGKKVTLYVDPTVTFGNHRGGLRLKLPASAAPAAPPPPPVDPATTGDFDDEIPF